MKNKASVKYSKEKGFELKVGGKVISNAVIGDPAAVVFSNGGAKLHAEIFLDSVDLADLDLRLTRTKNIGDDNEK